MKRFKVFLYLFHPEAALHRCSYEKGVLKICSQFTGEHPCCSVISIKLQSNFLETTLRHGCSPGNLLDIFKAPFPSNTPGGLLLFIRIPAGIWLHILKASTGVVLQKKALLKLSQSSLENTCAGVSFLVTLQAKSFFSSRFFC